MEFFGGLFKREDNKITRKHAQSNQQKYMLVQAANTPPASDTSGYLAVLLFNLTAAFDEGHCVLALGSVHGELQTFSYYRHSHLKIKAPGLVAQLRYPMTFAQIIDSSGWIYHGNDGHYWQEHFDCGLAISVTADQCDRMLAYARAVASQPGTYQLFDNNCLDFARDALFKAGIIVLGKKGEPVNTMIPKDFFKAAHDVTGASRFGQWKYWFKLAPKPPLPKGVTDAPS
jgi:hypothetical protein